MKTALFALVGVLALAGCGQATVPETADTVTDATTAVEHDAPAMEDAGDTMMEKTYTLDEIAQHTTKDDCWFAVSGTVYDVTPFIAAGKHPGGAAILEGCGKDATILFETRPMGSGTPHSEKAHESLAQFAIGTLAQ